MGESISDAPLRTQSESPIHFQPGGHHGYMIQLSRSTSTIDFPQLKCVYGDSQSAFLQTTSNRRALKSCYARRSQQMGAEAARGKQNSVSIHSLLNSGSIRGRNQRLTSLWFFFSTAAKKACEINETHHMKQLVYSIVT